MKYILTVIALLLVGWKIFDASVEKTGDEFPNQPIQIVVPYSAGGGTDRFARIIQKALANNERLNVPVVIINRPGGSATIGSRFVKNSRPDGYRLLLHHEGIIATKLAGTVPYGAEAFEPVAQTGAKILLMIVREDSPYQSLPLLLEAAQKNPNEIRVGANQGSPAWFICKQLLAEYPGAEFNFIPASGSQRLTYLFGGKLEAGVFSLDEYQAFRKPDDVPAKDNILAIANFSQTRHDSISDVATSNEQGLKTHAENAFYFWAPLGTPADVVAKLAEAFDEACKDQEVVVELNRLSIPIIFRQGDDLKQHLQGRESAFEGIAVKEDATLPNFAAWLIGIVGLLLVAVVGQSFLRTEESSHAETPVSESKDDKSGFQSAPIPPAFNQTGFVSLGLLCGYVLLLQFNVPFVIATTATIFLIGATIAKWDVKRLLAIGQIALVVGLGIELVFTKLFTVPLP